jgi:hypothetical protein
LFFISLEVSGSATEETSHQCISRVKDGHYYGKANENEKWYQLVNGRRDHLSLGIDLDVVLAIQGWFMWWCSRMNMQMFAMRSVMPSGGLKCLSSDIGLRLFFDNACSRVFVSYQSGLHFQTPYTQ